MKDPIPSSITAEQCLGLIERICSSVELKRAGRLKDFLHYVGQRSLQGDQIQISEYEIGVHVFGRPDNYDTSSDNIVRVNASELRKRIATYYTVEGIDETIVVDIPRGSYTPHFSLRSQRSTNVEKENAAAHPEQNDKRSLSGAAAYWWKAGCCAALAMILVLAAAFAYLAYQNHLLHERIDAWKDERTVGPFWSSILESPRETDILLADTSIAAVEFILKNHISLSGYLNHEYDKQIEQSNLSDELKGELEDLAARNNGSVSDFRIAQTILDLEPNSPKVHLHYARDYRPRNAAGHNIVVIGSSISNPWTSLFEDQLNFVIGYDSDTKQMVVRNRNPRPGESPVYTASTDLSNSIDFATVDYIPNQNQSGDVVIIAGTNSAATEAAGDFVTNEGSLRAFADALHTARLPYFELMLKTTRLGGAPIKAEILAYRTFPDHPSGTH